MFHEDRGGRWQLLVREPEARVRADVLVLEDYEEHMAAPVRQSHPAATFVPLILNFGQPYRLLDPTDPAVAVEHRSFVGGLGESPAITESAGTALCVQVNLTPLGARRLLGVPLRELADRVVPLSDVLGKAASRLEEQLAEAADPASRLDLVESFVAARLAGAVPTRPDVTYAWRRLEETAGALRIGTLAAELGCSRKHLNAQFREHVGLGPKVAARLLRFNRALGLLGRGILAAEVAYRCGYADQPHLVKEFRRFSGTTPAAYAREQQVPFVQDVATAAA